LQAPLLLLVAFGMYMLLLLVYGAVTFRSCPEEAQALHAVRSAQEPAHRPQHVRSARDLTQQQQQQQHLHHHCQEYSAQQQEAHVQPLMPAIAAALTVCCACRTSAVQEVTSLVKDLCLTRSHKQATAMAIEANWKLHSTQQQILSASPAGQHQQKSW
jgi:hypothetical protein